MLQKVLRRPLQPGLPLCPSRPKTLSCKGKEVENVFNIRTVDDANRVVKLATSKNAVVVGASFLGEPPSQAEFQKRTEGGARDFPRSLSLRCPTASLHIWLCHSLSVALFPGMEVAAYLAEKAHSVSVVELEETPFQKFFGEKVGHAILKVTASFAGGGARGSGQDRGGDFLMAGWSPLPPLLTDGQILGTDSNQDFSPFLHRCLKTTG